MIDKNKIGSFSKVLGSSFIMSLALVMISNATENPFETNLLKDSYILADGHKHSEPGLDDQKKKECNPDKGQNCNPPLEIKDDKKKKECNPDKGQNCNPPSW